MMRRFSILSFVFLAVYLILSISIAKMTYEASPERALKFRSNYSKALIELNNQDLVNSKSGITGEGVKKRAPALLKSAPLTPSVFWQLGLLEYANANKAGANTAGSRYDQAKPLLQIAQKRNLRNQATAIGLHDIGALTGDYGVAAKQLDLLMRLSEGKSDTYLPLILYIARNPGAQESLVEMVLKNPTWAQKFMDELIVQEGKLPLLSVAIINAARASGGTSFNADGVLQNLLRHLVKLGEYKEAKRIWQGQNFKETPQVSHIYDETFRRLQGELPFNWYVQQKVNGYAAFETPSGLLVSSNGRKQAFLAQQMLVLPDNRDYVLQVDGQGQFRSRNGGFVLVLVCAGTGQKLTEIVLDKLKPGLQKISVNFSLNDDKCRAQYLQIFGRKAQFPSQVQMVLNKVEIREAADKPSKGDE